MQRKSNALPQLILSVQGVYEETSLKRIHGVIVSPADGTGWTVRRSGGWIQWQGRIAGRGRLELFFQKLLVADFLYVFDQRYGRSPCCVFQKTGRLPCGGMTHINP